MRAWASIGAAAIVMTTLSGCVNEQGDSRSVTADGAYGDGYALGWLGARVVPVSSIITVSDPETGEPRVTGGMSLSQLHDGGPLATSGARTGDVLVKVGDTWMPNKEDPSLDLYQLVESEVSAGLEHVRLVVLRDGALASIDVPNDRVPLEIGGAAGSERLQATGAAGLDRLGAWQSDDGQVGAETDLSATALAGLAFIAGGREVDATRLEKCRAYVDAAVVDGDRTLNAWDAAWATLFLAEAAGPLEIEAPTITMSAGPGAGGLSALPEGVNLPDGVVIGEPVIISSDGELPEGFEMPEGMPDLNNLPTDGSIQIISVGGPPPGAAPTATPTPEMTDVDGPMWSSEELQMLAGPEAAARLVGLAAAVDRLVALQDESGGWDGPADAFGYSDRTLATNQALMALGAAERAGVAVDNAVLRRGLAYLRTHTNDGHVFAVEEPGFDRRREAGRSSGAAAALMSLNCVDGDEFHAELIDYSGDHAGTVTQATSGVPLHTFNTAVLRRQLGRAAWATWFEEFRHVLVGLQDPDGSFAPMPLVDAGSPAAQFDTDATSRTALWTLCALMASDRLPLVCAVAENPLQVAMDSTGARVAGGAMPSAPGEMQLDQAQILQMLEGADLPEGIREAIESGQFEISTDGG